MEGVFAFLDVLLGGAALVVEAHHPVWFHRQVDDDEADFGEQVARVPFDLGDRPARLVPGCRLILEVFVEALDLGLRWDDPRAGSAGARCSRAVWHCRAAGWCRISSPPLVTHRLQGWHKRRLRGKTA